MRLLLLFALVATRSAPECGAQISTELSYGVDRNVGSAEAELDGWLNGTVEWVFPSGLGLGIGTDHQSEAASVGPGSHLGWAIYLSGSFEIPSGPWAPFARAGVGLGREPCEGDTCGGGVYLRGSAGLRVRLVGELRASAEVGVSRVSRPFCGAGLSVRF